MKRILSIAFALIVTAVVVADESGVVYDGSASRKSIPDPLPKAASADVVISDIHRRIAATVKAHAKQTPKTIKDVVRFSTQQSADWQRLAEAALKPRITGVIRIISIRPDHPSARDSRGGRSRNARYPDNPTYVVGEIVLKGDPTPSVGLSFFAPDDWRDLKPDDTRPFDAAIIMTKIAVGDPGQTPMLSLSGIEVSQWTPTTKSTTKPSTQPSSK